MPYLAKTSELNGISVTISPILPQIQKNLAKASTGDNNSIWTGPGGFDSGTTKITLHLTHNSHPTRMTDEDIQNLHELYTNHQQNYIQKRPPVTRFLQKHTKVALTPTILAKFKNDAILLYLFFVTNENLFAHRFLIFFSTMT